MAAPVDAGSIVMDEKECKQQYYAKYREDNSEKIKANALRWYHKNRTECIEKKRKRRQENTESDKKRDRENSARYREKDKKEYLAKRREYYQNNKEREKERQKKYRENNREKALECVRKAYRKNRAKRSEYARIYQKKNRENNSQLRIVGNLRTKMRASIVSQSADKYGSFKEMVGRSPNELACYLESLFNNGMSWSNYGVHGWHIDHIKPCASFDLTDPEQQKQCFHYSNLQPLWAIDNLKKGASELWQLQ